MYACAFCFDWCTQLIIFYCVLRHENLFARQRDCDEDDIDDDNVEWMKRRKKSKMSKIMNQIYIYKKKTQELEF